jgi:Xaa-Pro aminopeptidase
MMKRDEEVFLFPQIKSENANVIYETGLRNHGIVLAIKGKEKIVFADDLILSSIEDFLKETKKSIKIEKIENLEKFLKGEKVYLDFHNSSVTFYMKIKKVAKEIEDCSNLWLEKRARKKKEEVKRMKKASDIAKAFVDYFNENLEKNVTEEKLRMLIIEYFSKNNAYESFPSIVASGKHSAFPHHMPKNKKIESPLLIDRGCIYENYCSDITDVIEIKDKKMKEEYETLENIFYILVDNLPSLETAKELHSLYIKTFRKYGLKEMPHLIGHGIGLSVHELPIINERSNHLLSECVITLEPSIYKKDYGLRFERMVYISKRKAYVL